MPDIGGIFALRAVQPGLQIPGKSGKARGTAERGSQLEERACREVPDGRGDVGRQVHPRG